MKPEITKTPVFWGEKIFLWTLGILIIGIALFFLTYVIQSYRQESTHLANEIIKVSNNIQRETEHYFEKYKITLETLSLTPFVTKQETEVCNQVFEKLNADFPNVVNYAAVDKNGAFFLFRNTNDATGAGNKNGILPATCPREIRIYYGTS